MVRDSLSVSVNVKYKQVEQKGMPMVQRSGETCIDFLMQPGGQVFSTLDVLDITNMFVTGGNGPKNLVIELRIDRAVKIKWTNMGKPNPVARQTWDMVREIVKEMKSNSDLGVWAEW